MKVYAKGIVKPIDIPVFSITAGRIALIGEGSSLQNITLCYTDKEHHLSITLSISETETIIRELATIIAVHNLEEINK